MTPENLGMGMMVIIVLTMNREKNLANVYPGTRPRKHFVDAQDMEKRGPSHASRTRPASSASLDIRNLTALVIVPSQLILSSKECLALACL
ncbi:hypothetical protein RJT34_23386 [Clitoria ternatea]|uniref:Uncharacterized protein n=1 Tax=Clitoria ternatea TaxID=43366 RepID=A0AAN9FUK4_CLITE